MEKFRIQIRDEEGRHIKGMTIYSENIDETIEKIRAFKERQIFESIMTERLIHIQNDKKLNEFFASDLFDREAVGSDISYKEFLDNEIWFEVH